MEGREVVGEEPARRLFQKFRYEVKAASSKVIARKLGRKSWIFKNHIKQMALKHKKRYLFIIWEIQIKTTVRHSFSPSDWQTFKSLHPRLQKSKHSYFLLVGRQKGRATVEDNLTVCNTTTCVFVLWPPNTSRNLPWEHTSTNSIQHITVLLIVVLFLAVNYWKQSKCLFIGNSLNELKHIHTME